jgi:hypothetical protein
MVGCSGHRLRRAAQVALLAALPYGITGPVFAADKDAGKSLAQKALLGGNDDVADSEKAPRAATHISRMKESLKRLLTLLEEARESKDVVKLNCVNEKLTQTKGLLRISEQAEDALQEALARHDREVGNHEFAKISISRQKTEQIAAEAESCVGELAVYAGDTVVTVEGGYHGGYDPTIIPLPLPEVVRPPQVSPYQ